MDVNKLREIRKKYIDKNIFNCVAFGYQTGQKIYSINGVSDSVKINNPKLFKKIEYCLGGNVKYMDKTNAFSVFRCHTIQPNDGLKSFYKDLKLKTQIDSKLFANMDGRIYFKDKKCQIKHSRLYSCAEKKLYSDSDHPPEIVYVTAPPCNYCLPIIKNVVFYDYGEIYIIERVDTAMKNQFKYTLKEID